MYLEKIMHLEDCEYLLITNLLFCDHDMNANGCEESKPARNKK